jgi:hypothetical protein
MRRSAAHDMKISIYTTPPTKLSKMDMSGVYHEARMMSFSSIRLITTTNTAVTTLRMETGAGGGATRIRVAKFASLTAIVLLKEYFAMIFARRI